MKTINQKVILLFFSFWCLILTAQPSNEAVIGTIQGKVIDGNRKGESIDEVISIAYTWIKKKKLSQNLCQILEIPLI